MFKILEETNSISIAILDWIEIFIAWIFIIVSHFAPLKIIMVFLTVKKFMKINVLIENGWISWTRVLLKFVFT